MLFCVGNGAMNVQQYWQLRKECLANICYGATVFVAAFPIVNERWQSKKFFLLSIITDSLSSLCVACIFTVGDIKIEPSSKNSSELCRFFTVV
jgi:hypothetical protein